MFSEPNNYKPSSTKNSSGKKRLEVTPLNLDVINAEHVPAESGSLNITVKRGSSSGPGIRACSGQ
jgi:hypothetical protein